MPSRHLLDELPALIAAARPRLSPHIVETPATRALWRDDIELYLKCEHLQHTGSFKLRGALNRLLNLTEAQRAAGVVAASTGNHGQGVALAGRITGTAARVFVPATTAAVKLAAMRAMGAEIVTVDGDGLAAELAARAAAERSGQVFVSPYNDPLIVAGQGTIGLELSEQVPDLDAVFIATGGGGMAAGVAAALKARQPRAQVYGCWPENAPALHRCLEAGRIMEVAETATISDGTAGGVEPGAITFELCRELIDVHVLVSETAIGSAMRLLAEQERWIVEGAAGVALAGCLDQAAALAGQRVAVVLCGRNIDFTRFLEATAGS